MNRSNLAKRFPIRSRRRKGSFRCWPPKYWQLCLVFIIICNSLEVGQACKDNEAHQCNNDSDPSNCSCVKCLVCPPGQGLYPQCGTTLKGNMTMKCLPCPNGMFSNQSDFASCHACEVCIGEETLRECNAFQNAICDKERCKDGYRRKKHYPLCKKVYVPSTPSTPSTTTKPSMTTSIRKGIINNTSDIPFNKTSQIVPTSIKPPNTPHKHNWIPSLETIVYLLVAAVVALTLAFGIKKRQKIIRFFCDLYCSCRGQTSEDQQASEENSPLNQQGQDQGQDEIALDILEQGGGMDPDQSTNPPPPLQQGESSAQDAPRSDQPDHQDLEEIISSSPDLQTVDQAPDISSPPAEQQGEGVEEPLVAMHMPTDTPDLSGQLLKDIAPEIKDYITLQISDKCYLKGWKEVGGLLGVDETIIEEIRIRCDYPQTSKLPGELLLESLKASIPSLEVEEFIKALKSVGRNDIVQYIYEKCSK